MPITASTASTTTPPQPAFAWGAEWRGGLNATAAVLPFALVYGVIAFGALGAPMAGQALGASLLALVVGGLLLVLLSRSTLPAASPSASACLILGSTVTQWVRQSGGTALTTETALALMALAGLTVMLGGLVMLALGALRVGSLAGFVPQPVLSGFMNGVALLIVWSQLPALLGLAPEALAREGWRAFGGWQFTALVVGLVTLAAGLWLRLKRPTWPAALLALVAGCLVVYPLGLLWPALTGQPWPVAAVGTLVPAWPQAAVPALLGDGALAGLLSTHARSVLATGVVLGLIGALETVLNATAVDQQLRRRSDPNHLLVSVGATNLALGALGGLPVVYMRLRATATASAGGRTWRAMAVGSLLLAAVFVLAAPLGAFVPRPVVAGIVVMLAWTLTDSWSLKLVRRGRRGDPRADRVFSLAVVAAVCGVTVVSGFVAGVALGVLLSFVLLVRSLNRSLVRARHSGESTPSRRMWPPAHEMALAGRRGGIDVVELEGALFFGNVERLRREVSQPPRWLPLKRWAVVIDLRRVSTIDASAAVALEALRVELARTGVALLLAGVTADNRHGQVLRALNLPGGEAVAEGALHVDADHAVEAAERLALAEAGLATEGEPVDPADSTLFAGLDGAGAEALRACMPPQTLAAGETLFRQGEPGDTLFLVEAGSVTVRDPRSRQRFVSFSPGMIFGETSLLDGGGRTAEAVADGPSRVRSLSEDDLQRLREAHPDAAAQVYLNIARHLSTRLREAVGAWRRAAG